MKTLAFAALCLLAIALPGCAQGGSGERKSDQTGSGPSESQAPPQGSASAPGSSAAAPESLLVIDVRTADEYAQGHLAGALNIPYDEIASRIAAVAPDKNRRLVLYCRSGRRSGIAQQTLQGLGYQRVENAGGYEDLIRR